MSDLLLVFGTDSSFPDGILSHLLSIDNQQNSCQRNENVGCVDAQLYMCTCERTPLHLKPLRRGNWAWIFPGVTDGDGRGCGRRGLKGGGPVDGCSKGEV